MKLTSLIVALTLASLTSSALASDKTKDANATKSPVAQQPKKVKAKAPQKQNQVALTGSYVKRDFQRNGMVTDGPNPVFVLDSQSIDTSGASDLRQLLIRRGFTR